MRATLAGVELELDTPNIAAGVIIARGCTVEPAPAPLERELVEAIETAKSRKHTDEFTGPVRDMLRYGKYKPTGRGKPASEYLHRAALEDRFPRINNLVDINNLVSLRSLLPISLVDLERACSRSYVIRRGRSGESFIFNAAGQVIELEDLLLIARLPDDLPCANPVKDSLATKLDERSRDVLAVIYAPTALDRLVREASSHFERALRDWGRATEAHATVLTA